MYPPGYAQQPMQPMYPQQPGFPQQQHVTNIVVVNQPGVVIEQYHGCCAQAMVDVTESQALVIFILNIIFPSLGTLYSSCMDHKGCNWVAFFLAWAQSFLTLYLIGWIWSIVHGWNVY